MAREKGKFVDKYLITQKLFTHHDQSEYYSGQHRVLKRGFTLRKIKLPPGIPACLGQMEIESLEPGSLAYQINAQVQVLRHLNGHGSPRCYQIIRTTNHAYLVYEQFPAMTLREHLAASLLTCPEKLQLLLRLAQTLMQIHELGVLIVGLSFQSIRVGQQGELVFADMSLARRKGRGIRFQEGFWGQQTEEFPTELVERGMFGEFTDVFMLGRVFGKVLSLSASDSMGKYRGVGQLVQSMTRSRPEDRPTLEQVVSELQGEVRISLRGRKQSQNECSSALLVPPTLSNSLRPRKFSCDSTPSLGVCVQPKEYRIEQQSYFLQAKEPSPRFSKKAPSVYTAKTAKNLSSPISPMTLESPSTPTNTKSRSISSVRTRSSSRNIPEEVKAACKTRNLAFHLLSLSEFALEQSSLSLAFLLTKYAHLTLKSCLSLLEGPLSTSEQQLRTLIANEANRVASTQQRMAAELGQWELSPSFRRELGHNSTISDRLLSAQIVAFGWGMLQQIESDVSSRSLLLATQLLFRVLQVAKKIEKESYEEHWSEAYQQEWAHLSWQKWLQGQKQLGLRYLRSKLRKVLQSFSAQ